MASADGIGAERGWRRDVQLRRVILYALVATACGSADVQNYEPISSSALMIGTPGTQAPQECRHVGDLFIPRRDLSLADRLSSMHIGAFFDAVAKQARELDANYLVPIGSDPQTAAETGAAFHGALFACPDVGPDR